MFSIAGYQIDDEQEIENGLNKIKARHTRTSTPVVIHFLSTAPYPGITADDLYKKFSPLKKLTSENVTPVLAVKR